MFICLVPKMKIVFQGIQQPACSQNSQNKLVVWRFFCSVYSSSTSFFLVYIVEDFRFLFDAQANLPETSQFLSSLTIFFHLKENAQKILFIVIGMYDFDQKVNCSECSSMYQLWGWDYVYMIISAIRIKQVHILKKSKSFPIFTLYLDIQFSK